MSNNVRTSFDSKGLPWHNNSCSLDSIRFLFGKCYHFTKDSSAQVKVQFRNDFPLLVKLFDNCGSQKLLRSERLNKQREWINFFFDIDDNLKDKRWFHITSFPITRKFCRQKAR